VPLLTAGRRPGRGWRRNLRRRPAHLIQRDITHMLGQAPPVPERVGDLAFPLAPESVRERAGHTRPALQGPGPGGVDVAGL
jgi:hypothetical protein